MNGESIDAIADHAVSTVTRTLQFVLMLEQWRPSCLRHVSMASRIARLMCVFLTGIEVKTWSCVFIINFNFLFRIDSVNISLMFLSQEMTCFLTAKFTIIYQPFYGFMQVPQDKTSSILILRFRDSPLSMICKFTASLFSWVICLFSSRKNGTVYLELKQPRKQRRQKPDRCLYLTMKNSGLHASHGSLSCLYISQLFSCCQRHEMACFAVLWTTWTLDDKFSFFFFQSPKRPHQFKSRILCAHFSGTARGFGYSGIPGLFYSGIRYFVVTIRV